MISSWIGFVILTKRTSLVGSSFSQPLSYFESKEVSAAYNLSMIFVPPGRLMTNAVSEMFVLICVFFRVMTV